MQPLTLAQPQQATLVLAQLDRMQPRVVVLQDPMLQILVVQRRAIQVECAGVA
jgi:hypothetical protein